MAKQTPYRTLAPEKRVALVRQMMASKEGRALMIARLAAKNGFRPMTLQSWPADKLAKEIVRTKAESPEDELNLLHLLYVELEPHIQATFLDAAGVKHEKGVMADDLEAPYADAAGVERGIAAVRAAHGEDGERYLQTLAKYASEGWPGIGSVE